jgi:hypothetical protein
MDYLANCVYVRRRGDSSCPTILQRGLCYGGYEFGQWLVVTGADNFRSSGSPASTEHIEANRVRK